MARRSEYLLFTEALRHASGRYLWRFMLLATDGDQTVTASDLVDEDSAIRTELLSLVRGLEAADAPSNVRLFTSSAYIHRGLARGLAQWRSQNWHWERFGRRVPIRDVDLWKRVDHALQFHQVDSRVWGETEHPADQLCLDMVETDPQSATSAPREPALATSSDKHSPRRRRQDAYLGALGNLQHQVESMLNPGLLPTG